MKIKQLMLAPVALGMIAPVAANAADLNLAAVNQYSSSDQVTSVSQFSDVKPTDWAYQALSNLVNRYGCVAGYPNGTFGGAKAMTRFEAAALLNACLDRVTETTDELKLLLKEFGSELTVLRGRVNGLEAKVGQLEATQFSTTTKLHGETFFTLAGIPGAVTNAGQSVGSTTFNYDLRLKLDTSFTGKDLLRTRLRAGNFVNSPFDTDGSLFQLDKATGTNNLVKIDRLYYQFPVTKGLTATAAAIIENNDLAWIPSAYESNILNFFDVAGAPGVYNKVKGAGGGFQYIQPGKQGVILGANYISQSGNDSTKGEFNSASALNLMAQVGYRAPQWGAAFGYRYGTQGTAPTVFNGVGGATGELANNQYSNGYAINAYWQPQKSGIVPSVSGAYSWNTVSGVSTPNGATNNKTWFVGLQWSDVFAKGNNAGIAYGQPGNANGVTSNASIMEIFYKYKVSDNISITPAILYVSNNQQFQNASSNWGGVIQTKFTF